MAEVEPGRCGGEHEHDREDDPRQLGPRRALDATHARWIGRTDIFPELAGSIPDIERIDLCCGLQQFINEYVIAVCGKDNWNFAGAKSRLKIWSAG